MPVFVEAGSQNPKGGVSAARQDEAHDEQVEQVDALDETHVGSQYGAINLDSHHAAQAMHHLPSPSPTPSPRGSSSSLAVSNSGDGTLYPHHNGRGSSGSFENPAVSIMDSAENEDRVPLSPLLVSKTRPPRDLDDIPEKIRKPSKLSITTRSHGNEKTYKLTAAEMEELTSAPESLPLTPSRSPLPVAPPLAPSPVVERNGSASDASHYRSDEQQRDNRYGKYSNLESLASSIDANDDRRPTGETTPLNVNGRRPNFSSRGVSSPQFSDTRIPSSHTKVSSNPISPKRKPVPSGARPEHLDTNLPKSATPAGKSSSLDPPPSPIPQSIPLPPMSIPTYLQLELSSSMPSPLYIYRSSTSDNVYESSKIKFERLLNFLLLPPQLEQVLVFGSFACLDAWLYTFTILPLRFLKAASILIQWWGQALAKEIQFISGFIYHGLGRMWHRQRGRAEITDSAPQSRNVSQASQPHASATSHQPQSGGTLKSSNGNTFAENLKSEVEYKSRQGWGRRHRRTRSQPSSLSSNHKADLLQGAVIICSCIILMKLDASRMYHSIRGQATIKLYVIYNVLEVCDKLFSALGQDIFECLFSVETLGRDLHGRSKVIRPLGMFILALIYNVIHATALFYQVVTLNVAVNSYSNALLTLLMSNQFVEIKSSVFKKIEKDNLFQLTCADVVERFQLWLMLMIIALRNIVEVGGLSIVNNGISGAEFVKESVPIRTNSILPVSFTILPSWAGEVLSPFLLVIGSEMLVDWVKHAYINKFNNVKPAIYQRYLDILGKDYYTNAFVNQNLVKRLGLPVIPLSCLFIRSSVQTYHMFLATNLPAPIPSTATELSATASPATTAALEHFDNIIRKALGRSALGIPDPASTTPWYLPSADDAIAAVAMLVFFLGAFFVLLACKLVLGMLLLRFARNRYRNMKNKEHASYDTGGRRLGGWGMVEVDEAKRRWIYDDDPEALRKLREKERAYKEKQDKEGPAGQDFGKISRYEMVKRIW